MDLIRARHYQSDLGSGLRSDEIQIAVKPSISNPQARNPMSSSGGSPHYCSHDLRHAGMKP